MDSNILLLNLQYFLFHCRNLHHLLADSHLHSPLTLKRLQTAVLSFMAAENGRHPPILIGRLSDDQFIDYLRQTDLAIDEIFLLARGG